MYYLSLGLVISEQMFYNEIRTSVWSLRRGEKKNAIAKNIEEYLRKNCGAILWAQTAESAPRDDIFEFWDYTNR